MPFIDCIKSDASLEEIMTALLVRDPGTGTVGLRTVKIIVNAPTQVFGCGDSGLGGSALDILRRAITTDSEGKPALALIEET